METGQRRIIMVSWINVIAAILLVASPYIVGFHIMAAKLNDIYIGIAIGILSLIRALYTDRSTTWLTWVNEILGAWLILAPFALGYTLLGEIWDNIVLGIFIFTLNLWAMQKVTEKIPSKITQEAEGHNHGNPTI